MTDSLSRSPIGEDSTSIGASLLAGGHQGTTQGDLEWPLPRKRRKLPSPPPRSRRKLRRRRSSSWALRIGQPVLGQRPSPGAAQFPEDWCIPHARPGPPGGHEHIRGLASPSFVRTPRTNRPPRASLAAPLCRHRGLHGRSRDPHPPPCRARRQPIAGGNAPAYPMATGLITICTVPTKRGMPSTKRNSFTPSAASWLVSMVSRIWTPRLASRVW